MGCLIPVVAGKVLTACRAVAIGAAGFEPTTPTTPKWCATKLRYAPAERSYHSGFALPAGPLSRFSSRAVSRSRLRPA
jgi:hypothetical protein